MPPDELEEMRVVVAALLAEHASPARVRDVMASGEIYDAILWRRLADELGLIAATVPERCGGLGLGFTDGAVLLGEFARRLTPVPLTETMVAASVLGSCHTDGADALLERIVAEAPVIALGGADPLGDSSTAVRSGDAWLVTGSLHAIPFGGAAGVLLLTAESESGPTLFVVDAATEGVHRVSRVGLDATRPLADITLKGVSAHQASAEGDGDRAAALLSGLTLVGQSVEAAAGAAACLDMTVGYLKVREQFGRPIGSFQALKHRCADHAVTVAGSKATARHAALAVDAEVAGEVGDEPLAVLAPLAKAVCADAYFYVAADTIQLHGGIGFTFEHDAHLYLKRAKATQHLYGHPSALRRGLAAAAGL